MADDEDWERIFPGPFIHEDVTWTEFFEDNDTKCCFCDQPVDDRRFAVGIAIRRSWPGSVEYRFCHIECLRKTMHHSLPLR